MDHPTRFQTKTAFGPYSWGHDEVARKLADLRYDALAEILEKLAVMLHEDSNKDLDRHRPRLAFEVGASADRLLYEVVPHVRSAWELCKPRMPATQTETITVGNPTPGVVCIPTPFFTDPPQTPGVFTYVEDDRQPQPFAFLSKAGLSFTVHIPNAEFLPRHGQQLKAILDRFKGTPLVDNTDRHIKAEVNAWLHGLVQKGELYFSAMDRKWLAVEDRS